jgi:hypothetical protein
VEYSTYGSCFDPVIFFTNNLKVFTVFYVILHKIVAVCLESRHFTLSVDKLAEPPRLSTFSVGRYLYADKFVPNVVRFVHFRVKKIDVGRNDFVRVF